MRMSWRHSALLKSMVRVEIFRGWKIRHLARPKLREFVLDSKSGYYFNQKTGLFYDKKSKYYYDQKTAEWMFWSDTYKTYIPCLGGDVNAKNLLQMKERQALEKEPEVLPISPSPDSEVGSDLFCPPCSYKISFFRASLNFLARRSPTEFFAS